MESSTQDEEKKFSLSGLKPDFLLDIYKERIEFFKDVDEAEINTKKDLKGQFAIHLAASWNNNLPELKRLLSIGADINSKDNNDNTPLHCAATHNFGDSHFDVIKMLLELGAKINAQNKKSMTPLYYLIGKYNIKTVNLLLDLGADVNIKDYRGETPFSRALSRVAPSFDVLKLLLNFGSDINNLNNRIMTPLHKACNMNNIKVVKFLVRNSANVNALNSKGRTPLMRVLEHCNLSADWVKFLIKYSDVNTIDSSGKNILCLPAIESHQNIWKIILEHVAKLWVLEVPIHQRLHETISNEPKFQEYLKQCMEELKMAKSTKLKNCWVTYFNLLLDRKIKLKNYAGNRHLVQDFKNSDCLKKFSIYGAEILKKVNKGIETRKSFDKSSVELSCCLPIFNPTHLIIKDVLDFLTFKDYNRLVLQVLRAQTLQL